MKTILSFALLATLFLFSSGWSKEEEILVKLDTEVQLIPLYLGHFIDDQSGFDRAYLNELEKVLKFDLDYNGMTYVVPHSGRQESKEAFESLGSPEQLKTIEGHPLYYYVVMAKVNDKKLSARLLSLNARSVKAVQDILLTGQINEDRKKIHLVADTFFKAMFNKEGIATTRILYTVKSQGKGAGQWVSDIWEADYDGENAVKLTQGNGYCITPAYVPPSSGYSSGGFFYVSYQQGQPKIYYASFKEGVGRRFCYLRGNQLMPAISRQRDQVAFVSDAAGNPDLFLQPFNVEAGAVGKPRQIFSARQAVQGTPSFSPDGRQIAFVSNKDGSARIYVMDIPAPGTYISEIRTKLVSKQSRESTAPAWSPDGTKIAYCALTGQNRQIWIYDFEKGEEKQLTQGKGNKENPTWAPDSLHLLFNSTDAHESELFLVNLNQPEAKKITTGSGEKHYPCWEPR